MVPIQASPGGGPGAGGATRHNQGCGGASSGNAAQGKNINMLYSSQPPIIWVLPEWMPIYNRCLSSVKTLANQQQTLGLRARFRDALQGLRLMQGGLRLLFGSQAVSFRRWPQGKLRRLSLGFWR